MALGEGKLNPVLDRYGEIMYYTLPPRPAQHVSELLNGICGVYPLLRGRLTLPCGVVREWRRIEPTEAHSSIPISVILAMIASSFLRGYVKSTAGVWLAGSSGLRPIKMRELPWKHISFFEDCLDFESRSIFIPIYYARTGWAGSSRQSVRTDDEDLLELRRAVQY